MACNERFVHCAALPFRCVLTQCSKRVPSSSVCIALTTNYFEVIELAKSFGHSAFRDEEAFAIFAPSLKVVGVGAVLDKAHDAASCLKVMTANNGAKFLCMGSASCYRTGVHGSERRLDGALVL